MEPPYAKTCEMAAQGATLQNYNGELVKSIEDLRGLTHQQLRDQSIGMNMVEANRLTEFMAPNTSQW